MDVLKDMKIVKSKKVWSLVVVIVGVVILAVIFVLRSSNPNYAQETAKPLVQGIKDAGGKLISAGGEAGRNADNEKPYYDAQFDVPFEKESAVKLVKDVASRNGFNLTHASMENRGYLGAVADKYIDQWYFDNVSKDSSYGQLQAGKVQVAFRIGDEDIKVQDGHVVIRLNVQLPAFKSRQ